MPKAAVDIAMESVCVSTRTKYDAMFKKFVFYGQSVGTNILLYNFSAVLVIGFSFPFIPLKVPLVLSF